MHHKEVESKTRRKKPQTSGISCFAGRHACSPVICRTAVAFLRKQKPRIEFALRRLSKMPAHTRSAVAGTTALLVCAVSSVSAYTISPLLRAGHHSRLQALQPRAARRVAVGPSMIYTPPRIDENDLVAVENLKRSLDRLVEMPSAEPSDQVVRDPQIWPPISLQPIAHACLARGARFCAAAELQALSVRSCVQAAHSCWDTPSCNPSLSLYSLLGVSLCVMQN